MVSAVALVELVAGGQIFTVEGGGDQDFELGIHEVSYVTHLRRQHILAVT